MKRLTFAILCLVFIQNLQAQKKELNYYLPEISYDNNIPTPEEYLGYQVGEWHVSHDLLVAYMKVLAEKSNRITIENVCEKLRKSPTCFINNYKP